MSQPVAIITGGASGIGLALTKYLLSQSYLVAIADIINAEDGNSLARSLGPSCIFHRTDVSVYADQAALFSHAFTWGGNRLDFVALNAGIDDQQSLYLADESLDEDGMPLPLNLKALDVNLNAVVQGIWLFKHYARKNQVPGGKIVITSSAAGL